MVEWREENNVTEAEVKMAISKMKSRKAPGPDGIPGSVVRIVGLEFSGLIARLFTECLREGCFPKQWKEASLVLLRKAGKPENSPSAYHPIFLLGEMGKLLERSNRSSTDRIHDAT